MTIKVTVSKTDAFLDCEERIHEAVNEVGRIATERCLENFDTDGSPIVGAKKRLRPNVKRFLKSIRHRMEW